MKNLINFLLMFLLPIMSYSQDIITFKSGEEIKVKVEEITPLNVSYKKFENLNGPIYTSKKTEIFMIKFENGTKEIFNTSEVIVKSQNKKIEQLDYRRARFYLQDSPISLKEADEYIKLKNNANAYKTFMEGKKMYSGSKPARVFGMMSGIAGTVVLGFSSLIYSAFGENMDYNSKKDFKTVMITSGVVAVAGWTTFGYGISLNFNSRKKFKESVNILNGVQ